MSCDETGGKRIFRMDGKHRGYDPNPFSHPESYLDVGSLRMYLRAGQHCKQSNGSYWSTLSFGGLRRQVLLKYYDVKDPLSLVQKISKKVLSMPKSPRDTALYSVPWKSVPPVMMRPRS